MKSEKGKSKSIKEKLINSKKFWEEEAKEHAHKGLLKKKKKGK